MTGWRAGGKRGNHSQAKVLGTLGCYLSHYFVQKKALESQHGNYLVLEDDWNVEPECITAINEIFSQGLVGYDWDISEFNFSFAIVRNPLGETIVCMEG